MHTYETRRFIKGRLLKQFKNAPELTSFLEQLHKRGIEKLLEGELDAHLDYDKHKKAKQLTFEMVTQKRN